jgi:squalene synthase HpnC
MTETRGQKSEVGGQRSDGGEPTSDIRHLTSDIRHLTSGKSHRDENFPVASRLIHPRHRGIILAFYEFVRIADDIADHASLPPSEKIALLDQLEATLLGRDEEVAEAVTLRKALNQRKLVPRHAQDLLTAFRMDVTKLRYRDWDDLIGYCSYSAMPVGRFVCDVHGEDRAVWPANDALCAALQIINHLQDCAADYRNLDRVYVPLDALVASGASVEDLGRPTASPALRSCLAALAIRTGHLLDESDSFSARINDFRLAMEVAIIQALARRLVGMLSARDPLREDVHLHAAGFARVGVAGLAGGLLGRIGRSFAPLSRSYRA